MEEAEAVGESLGEALTVEGMESVVTVRLVDILGGRAVVLILAEDLMWWWV